MTILLNIASNSSPAQKVTTVQSLPLVIGECALVDGPTLVVTVVGLGLADDTPSSVGGVKRSGVNAVQHGFYRRERN